MGKPQKKNKKPPAIVIIPRVDESTGELANQSSAELAALLKESIMFSRRHYREVGGFWKRPHPLNDAVRATQMQLFKEVAFNIVSKFPNPPKNDHEMRAIVAYQNHLMIEANNFCFDCLGTPHGPTPELEQFAKVCIQKSKTPLLLRAEQKPAAAQG